MRRTVLAWIGVAMLFGTVPALAEEIIYFTNGSSMPIRSYVLDGDMIKIDMGDNSFIGFPMSMVDRIVKAGQDVMLKPSSGSNKMVDLGEMPGASHPVTAMLPSREGGQRWKMYDDPRAMAASAVRRDENGTAVYRPYANSSHPGRRQLGALGNMAIQSDGFARSAEQGIPGTYQFGAKHVIASKTPPMRGRVKGVEILNMELRPGFGTTAPPDPASLREEQR